MEKLSMFTLNPIKETVDIGNIQLTSSETYDVNEIIEGFKGFAHIRDTRFDKNGKPYAYDVYYDDTGSGSEKLFLDYSLNVWCLEIRGDYNGKPPATISGYFRSEEITTESKPDTPDIGYVIKRMQERLEEDIKDGIADGRIRDANDADYILNCDSMYGILHDIFE